MSSAVLRSVVALAQAVLFVALAPATAAVQSPCQPEWVPTFGGVNGCNGSVRAFATTVVGPGGSGTALYVGGVFTEAGGIRANRVVRWTGGSWKSLGSGLDGEVHALATFDDGTGEALYVGGVFTTAGGVPASCVAKWDGANWSALGSGMDASVECFAVFDDGSGPALYAGGAFTTAGGVAASHVAKWNGASWSPLGVGTDDVVASLAVYAGGAGGLGSGLYAGGAFTFAGGASASRIAKWDGVSWSALGGGLDGPVLALAEHTLGSGVALYVGGSFTNANGLAAFHVARWNGVSWSAAGSINGEVRSFVRFDDGSGMQLYSGGTVVTGVMRWTSSGWLAPLGPTLGGTGGPVDALAVFDTGHGPRLCAGGSFASAGSGPARNLAQWTSRGWVASGPGFNGEVRAFAVAPSANGPVLYVGGAFTSVSGVRADLVAKWDGESWSPLPFPVDGLAYTGSVHSLALFDDGAIAGVSMLYVGGDFTFYGAQNAYVGIARWTGLGWFWLASYTSGVRALTVFDDGSGDALYAGGDFTSIGGQNNAQHVARWNGTTWSTLGSGLNDSVRALTVFDDGSGDALYVGGAFATAGGVGASRVARWNGATWSALGSGMNATSIVHAFATYDDGSGPALYAGGSFTSAGGIPADRIASWNGAAWSALASGGMDAPVRSLGVFDDGVGDALFAGGEFALAGGVAARGIARWDSANWSALGGGIPGTVEALVAFDDRSCSGAALFAGGAFTAAVDSGDAYVAKWDCVPHAPTPGCFDPFCFGDGFDPNVTTACPCGNFGAAGHGCAHSANPSGALLTASGSALNDDVVLAASDMPATSTCIYLQGDGLTDAVFGDGVRCAGGALIRLRTRASVGGASAFPDSTDTISLSARGGVAPGSGSARYYQTTFRNAAAAFCPPGTSNLTNGWAVVW
ncbi:MAG: hypothetical protein HZA53_13225 [Planctomycetes bacterium]|nr:hypothetical protein [Planctomycetota bacterium]